MSVSDDVMAGVVCMQCLRCLVADDGKTVCTAGHPIYCEDCWAELPKKERDNGTPYFDEEHGKVATG